MNKEFIPYELQKELYELGFNDKTTGVIVYKKEGVNEFSFISEDFPTEWMSGILWQQAFRWFREKHNWIGGVRLLSHDSISGMLGEFAKDKDNSFMMFGKSYEEIELKCLEELIKILKNDTDRGSI